MTIKTLAAASALSLLALTGVASAQSAQVVPGSDHFRDARADARANDVIRSQFDAPVLRGATYGYPAVRGSQDVVPGSDHYRDARADARANSVIEGTHANERLGARTTFGFPARDVTGTGARIVGGDVVPGSDYFLESREDARANSVIEGTRANDVIVR